MSLEQGRFRAVAVFAVAFLSGGEVWVCGWGAKWRAVFKILL